MSQGFCFVFVFDSLDIETMLTITLLSSYWLFCMCVNSLNVISSFCNIRTLCILKVSSSFHNYQFWISSGGQSRISPAVRSQLTCSWRTPKELVCCEASLNTVCVCVCLCVYSGTQDFSLSREQT